MILERIVETYEQVHATRVYLKRMLEWKKIGLELSECEAYYEAKIEELEKLESKCLDILEKELNKA